MSSASDPGSSVRARRLQLGLSKEAMARAAGVSVITYKKVEDDKPVRDTSRTAIMSALDREEARRSGTAIGTYDVAGSARGGSDRFARPSWMAEERYADIMREVEDYFDALVRVARLDARRPS